MKGLVPSLLYVVLVSTIPVIAAFLGAVIAALRPPSLVVRSSIQHFAAGVIFSVIAVELLPEVRLGHDPFEVGWTFSAGVVFMLIIDAAVKRFNHGGEQVSKHVRNYYNVLRGIPDLSPTWDGRVAPKSGFGC